MCNDLKSKYLFRMFAVLRFLFFNVALSTTDVGTDFFTFLELLVDNPRWACLTLLWTVMPFLVHTVLFLYRKNAVRMRKGMTVHTSVKPAHRGLSTSNSRKVKKSVPTSVVDNATLKNKKRRTANILKVQH